MSTINNPTSITIKHHDVTVKVEIPYSDCTITEVFELFRGAVLAIGFQQETYESAILELAENINDKN